ncbi:MULTISPECIES: Fpg/Nei family DNA glycosylase [unclassified Schaalia]|uniref:Fpg/Nei family DNA glycosylase n=1 Tax=unclassified Schaalia TaxID=2691889 RepID=UPI001E61DCC9|nr:MULTISPECIES: zinc finger domain-containing protein [unclassified Schaalia]MCD4549416.1 Fpg/Nei family DNA glycosylase [Schaalia sp. lx-260]MCD4557977.1 Fpg/Nei family DNA glycosylase [Schaalia sp. lx-100]
MPEGDAVRRLAETFAEVFAGQRCIVSSPQGRFAASAAILNGHLLVVCRAVGKHMFLGFSTEEHAAEFRTYDSLSLQGQEIPERVDKWVHIHLGLYGWWRFNGDTTVKDYGHGVVHRVGPRDRHVPMRWGSGPLNAPAPQIPDPVENESWEVPEPIGQVRLRIVTTHAVADLAGPHRCELVTDEERCLIESQLGPDPLAVAAHNNDEMCTRFVEAVRRRKRTIGEMLMDQSIIAGVGNIYRADALFLAGISPMRRGDRISVSRLQHLWHVVCEVMNRGLAAGYLITMSPDEAPESVIEGDEEASRWYVYHRTGRPCIRCGTHIAEKLMNNRRLFWCPNCQR